MRALNDCTTCGKTAEHLTRRALEWDWECSHVECPNRRNVLVLEGFEPTGPAMGRTEGNVTVDVGNEGCFRRSGHGGADG